MTTAKIVRNMILPLLIATSLITVGCSQLINDLQKGVAGGTQTTETQTTETQTTETPSSEKQLLTFVFTTSVNTALVAEGTGTIDGTARTVAVTVPYGTAVTGLVATFTCSDGASVTVGSTAQTSGTTANDFTNAVTYTVTAEDGSTQTYAVTVTIDVLCENIVALPAGTNGSAGTTGSYVWFGGWPQTIEASGVTVDESTTKTIGANTYYKGSDGYWYAKATAAPYNNATDYTYTDGTTVTTGTDYYFKVEPIKWRVLESGKLLAESILANVCYYGSTSNRTLGSTTIYANNYKYSNIRAWLNGTDNQFVTDHGTRTSSDIDWSDKGFLQTVFTTTAQAKIATTAVDNSAASTTDVTKQTNGDGTNQYACDNTNDKIYLLSELTVTNSATYGFSAYDALDSTRRRTLSDYARATGVSMKTASGVGQYCGEWWLRSPASDRTTYVRSVLEVGTAKNESGLSRLDIGVVPGLSISQ